MVQRTALVRRPSPRLAEGLVTHIERSPIDLGLALRQWEAYVDVLREAGWRVVEVPEAPDCPDSVFVEDTVVMFRNVAVICRPGADERKPEVIDVEKVVEDLGCSINRIRPPGTQHEAAAAFELVAGRRFGGGGNRAGCGHDDPRMRIRLTWADGWRKARLTASERRENARLMV